MKKIEITKYKAFNGTLFDTQEGCEKYENLIRKIDRIMQDLHPIPEDTEFYNGEGYIQQTKKIVEKAKEELVRIGKVRYLQPELSFGWLGRWADDSGDRELYHAWGRLSNIDSKYREWGQGYFAINPEKGVQKEYKLKK